MSDYDITHPPHPRDRRLRRHRVRPAAPFDADAALKAPAAELLLASRQR